ncbi:hypothetical protein I6N98_06545 [Spongiibacter nanhainus]|uniref:DKNYY family protein n=1 Tax=Spongiibacter nanhainus TaxID=2794344 RepID=A0A7T4R3D0_9GAMM|nr:hypothetical protein [Spongiibacter nanhainus]QQD19504.1 hypothetical protein I6N98_06545 [Spongiibacter nanhainus]
MQRSIAASGLLLLVLATAACQNTAPPPVPKDQFTGLFRNMADCRDDYAKIDAMVAKAGVGNAAYHRVPGYPYLRTDRLTASFIDEVDSFAEINGWVRRMRELDQEAREFEYMNLGLSLRERANYRDRMLNCGKTLAALEINSPEKLERVKAAITLRDGYSETQRALGLYPALVPLIKARLSDQQTQIKARHQGTIAEIPSDQPLTLWKPKNQHDPGLIPVPLDTQFTDELGVPGLTTSGWKALVEVHAPDLWIETGDNADKFGMPHWTQSGLAVDTGEPVVFYHIDYTRFGGEVLVQLNYFLWFAGGEQVESGAAIDGIVWRVTLDRNGKALVYDSMHTSGRDHRWYPVQALQRRSVDSYWQQAPFFPSDSPAPDSALLRIGTGSHKLQGVAEKNVVETQNNKQYALVRYENLLALPLPGGGTRSLFDSNGQIRSTRINDPIWLWSSGVPAPGALRQYGHHTTSYIGREYFDDPRLLEKVFQAETGTAQSQALDQSSDTARRLSPHQNNWARHH